MSSLPGGDPSRGADICQPDVQLLPGHAAVLLGVPVSLAGLFSAAARHPAEPVHAGAGFDSCGLAAGGSGSAVRYTVRHDAYGFEFQIPPARSRDDGNRVWKQCQGC